MNKFIIKLTQHAIIALWIIAILGIFSFFRGCTTSKQIKDLQTELIVVKESNDSLRAAIYENFWTKEELDIRMEIHGLETSKRTLYDWNAVVRTVIRPDDKMKEYNDRINELRRSIR